MSEASSRGTDCAYHSLRPWRLMGRAEGDEDNAVDEPRLPCGIMVDPAIEQEANHEAETYGSDHHYVYNWPAVPCLPDMATAGVASIGMQLVEAILALAFAPALAEISCYLVIMAAAMVVKKALDERNQDKARVEWGYCLGDFRRLISHLAMQFAVTHIPKACTVFYQCFRLALSCGNEAPLPAYNQILSILCAFACFSPTCITIIQIELLYCSLVPLCEKEDFKGTSGDDEQRGYVDRQGKGLRPLIWLFRVEYTIACLFHLLAGGQIVMLLLGSRALLPEEVAFFFATDKGA